ncbi:hypothetical protein HDV03_001505 [Kappamyces sp. JEL0829]|nr:hypothetical protein HDV03_001505 [Kappamyces sp. JEL0829]
MTSPLLKPKCVKVLLLDPFPEKTSNAFVAPDFEVDEAFGDLTEAELVKKVQEYQVICLSRERNETVLTDEVLRSAHRLLAVGVFGSITNQVDTVTAQAMGIPVFTAPYQHQASVAELTISQIILLSRQIGDRSKEIHTGYWNKSSTNCTEVRGKTLGIVGYGHVGSQLGVMAEALSIKVLFYDTVSLMPIGNSVAVTSLSELLTKSDFVSVNITASPENKNLFGKEQFAMMKKGAFFLNASYGEAADINALAEAIKSGHLGGAAIDAYPSAPSKGEKKFQSPLQNLPNVILTPQYAMLTTEAATRAGTETTASIARYIKDGTTFGSTNFPSVAAWNLKKGNCRIVSMHKNVRGVLRVGAGP